MQEGVWKNGRKFRQIHRHILPRKVQQERCPSSLPCICILQFEPTSCCEKVLVIARLTHPLSLNAQFPSYQSYILDPSLSCLQRLVSFTDYKDSITRRGAILGLIKNCCFETGKLLLIINVIRTSKIIWFLFRSSRILTKRRCRLAPQITYSSSWPRRVWRRR